MELINYTATKLHGFSPQPGFNNNNTANQISEPPAGTSLEPDAESCAGGLDPDIVHLVDRTQHQICSSRTGQVCANFFNELVIVRSRYDPDS